MQIKNQNTIKYFIGLVIIGSLVLVLLGDHDAKSYALGLVSGGLISFLIINNKLTK